MEKIITIIISLTAMGISVYSIWINKRNNKKNLNKHFFEEIFFERMLKEIPNKLNELSKDKEKFSENCEDLNTLLWTLRDECIFFKYFDEKFYNHVLNILQSLDDQLITSAEKEDISVNEFKSDIESIKENISKFYKILKEYYF